MFGITDLGAYIAGAIAIILLPGPNSMYCLTVAGKNGAKKAYCAVAGILLGDSILMLLSALGATSVLKTIPILFLFLKTIGGLYLAYLGCGLVREAVKKWRLPDLANKTTVNPAPPLPPERKKTSAYTLFRHALFLSLFNPKAILFFLAFFVQFVDPNYTNPVLSFLLLAVILQICSISYLSVLIFSGVALVKWFHHYRRIAASAIGVVGMIFIGFAMKLWTATIN